MKHFLRLLIYNSYNINEILLIYYKNTNLTKKHKFNTLRKNYSFTFTYNEIIKRVTAEHIRHELVPLLVVRVNSHDSHERLQSLLTATK